MGSPKYFIAFLLLGGGQFYLAAQASIFNWLLYWSGASFSLVGFGYIRYGVQIFGKRPEGNLSIWSYPLLGPYLLFTWVVWFLKHRLGREDNWNEIIPGLYLGRRVYAHELPRDIIHVVDLTAEFPEPRKIRTNWNYHCFPTLDALIPAPKTLAEWVRSVAGLKGNVYIHCAEGHGRSAALVAGVLMFKGIALNVDEAESLIRKNRPGVKLNAQQKRCLQSINEVLLNHD